jgi:hypothetical protein
MATNETDLQRFIGTITFGQEVLSISLKIYFEKLSELKTGGCSDW